MIPKPKPILKNCEKCGETFGASNYFKVHSPFFPSNYLPICKDCLKTSIDPFDWDQVDRFCRWANYPFKVDKWAPLAQSQREEALAQYIELYCDTNIYESLDWKEENDKWKAAIKSGTLHESIEVLTNQRLEELKTIWGSSYSAEQLRYLDDFYQSLKRSYNVVTTLQDEAAKNLAKLSVRISEKLVNGGDIDKDIKSQSEIMKTAGFSVEQARNMNDIDSVGELCAYLEKTGWINQYYNGVAQDIVDKTMENIQMCNKRVIAGEPNLKDQYENKLATLGIGANDSVEFTDDTIKFYEDGMYEQQSDEEYDVEEFTDEELNI